MLVFGVVENVKPFCRNCESEKLEIEEEYLHSSFKRENEFGSGRHKYERAISRSFKGTARGLSDLLAIKDCQRSQWHHDGEYQ